MESATSVALGRYDAVMWGETRPLCRCPLPVFDKDLRLSRAEEDARRERFPTFFTRREMGFRFTLKGRWPKWAGFPKQEPVAFLAITLQRRSFRLSFLARLLYEIQEEWDVRGGHFGGMGSKFAKGDFGFLTDGWGDLVLVFGRGHPDRGAKRRLLEVFEVQEALYQDFMVDRTELILTPAAVDAALSDKNRWLVRTQARLLESRTAGRENDDFRAHVKKMSSRDNVQKVLSPIEVYRTPGRMDFALLMQSDGPKPVVDGFDAIMDLMDHESVDRVDTMIAKREEQEHETLRRGWRDPRKEPFGGRARWMKKARG